MATAGAADYPVQRGKEGFDAAALNNAAVLRAKAVQEGSIRLDVVFAVPGAATDLHTTTGVNTQIAAVNAAVADFQQRYGANIVGTIAHASLTPILSAHFSASGIDQLLTDTQAQRFEDPTQYQEFLNQANTLLQTNLLPTAIAATANTMVAVMDSGVDINHPLLAGRALNGACFSTPSGNYVGGGPLPSFCVNGANGNEFTPNPNAGKYCLNPNPSDAAMVLATNNCGHGMHVTGIAVGSGAIPGAKGMAPQTGFLAVQVSALASTSPTSNNPYARTYFTVDVVSGLDWVWMNRYAGGKTLVAVNMSFGRAGFNSLSTCQNSAPSYSTGINRLTDNDISVVAAAGNFSGTSFRMAYPACLGNVMSVAATNRSDQAATDYSVFGFDTANKARLLAPGGNNGAAFPPQTCDPGSANGAICAAEAGTFGEVQRNGTSMSAPIVTGLIARLRDRLNSNRVQTEQLMMDTGTPVFANAIVGNIARVAPYAAFREGSVPQTVAASASACNLSQVTWTSPRYFGVGSFSLRSATNVGGFVGKRRRYRLRF